MNLQTFKASTMAQALAQVKSAMGPQAVILHTRTYQKRYWLGIRRQEVVEITAGRGLRVPDRPQRRTASAPPLRAPLGYARSAASLTASGAATVTIDPVAAGRQILDTPGGNSAMMLGLCQEMDSLKTMVKDLVTHSRQQRLPQVPEELFEHYLQLIQNQVAQEIAADIVGTLQKQLRPEHLSQSEFVRQKLAEQLERMLPTAGPICRTKKTGPHVVALIGPTGVGKTTTLAKLAANLKLREKQQVGLITIDTYRIAAIDQLKKYADIIGAPLRVVANPEDLRDAVAAMSQQCQYILIDTAGRSPNDTLKLNELKAFLAAAGPSGPDEVHLVLSTTASQECVELAIERFSNVRVDKIIFTKLDEAAHVGVVLNVVRKVNKALSYITTGQDVPDDIEVGRGQRLAQLILGEAV